MANHYGVLIPRIQPPDGSLTIGDSDWDALRSLVAERLDGRVEINRNNQLRVLLFGSLLEVPVDLFRVFSEHAPEDVASIVGPELLRLTKARIEPV